MTGKRVKLILTLVFGAMALAIGALYVTLAWTKRAPATEHEFFTQTSRSQPLVIAHRGGAGLWPENTMHAFTRARDMGVDIIEFDVRSTADGVLVAIHDMTVERTTDGVGRVSEMTLADLRKLDAGYRWSPDGGRTFPLRGLGITVPTLEEVFTLIPAMRFIIEPKQESRSLAQPLCRLIRERGITGKVLVGSFSASTLEEFRRECPEVATSASPTEVSQFLAMQRVGLDAAYSPTMQALQVPEYAGGAQLVTGNFIAAAHARNLEVHVWTVNEVEDMRRLIDLGVNGIMTDYPDRLMTVLGRAPAR